MTVLSLALCTSFLRAGIYFGHIGLHVCTFRFQISNIVNLFGILVTQKLEMVLKTALRSTFDDTFRIAQNYWKKPICVVLNLAV